jgi:hypothetical protein
VIIGFVTAFMYGVAILLVSLPFMTGVNDDPTANAMIGATAVVMLGFGLFMTFGLIAVVKTRISLTAAALDATVPSHHTLLVPHFRTIALPLGQIRSVERRQEAFRSFGMTNLRESLSVVTTGGERIGIFSNTSGPASQLPLDEIAGAIATAAGTTVTDAGTVWTKAGGLYGEASSSWTEQPLDETTATKVRRAAGRTAQLFLVLLLLVIALRACG